MSNKITTEQSCSLGDGGNAVGGLSCTSLTELPRTGRLGEKHRLLPWTQKYASTVFGRQFEGELKYTIMCSPKTSTLMCDVAVCIQRATNIMYVLKVSRVMQLVDNGYRGSKSVYYSPNEITAILFCSRRSCRRLKFSCIQNRQLATSALSFRNLRCFIFHPNNNKVAKTWDVTGRGLLERRTASHTLQVSTVAFLDHQRQVTGDEDGMLQGRDFYRDVQHLLYITGEHRAAFWPPNTATGRVGWWKKKKRWVGNGQVVMPDDDDNDDDEMIMMMMT